MRKPVRPSLWKRLKRRLQAPFRVRALIRSNEIVYTLVAAIVGALAGLGVVAMQTLIELLGRFVFHYEGHGVSDASLLDPLRVFFGPVAGGVLLGITYLIARRYFRRVSDPIEANAIQGGRMELPSSLFICVQTVISSGFGASVGMEAAYTQNGSAIASKLGQMLHLRREDLRQLVAAGACGAIAAAFNAPLTGAFYAFELVLASYTVASLLPVIAAAISAVAVARTFGSASAFDLNFAGNLSGEAYALIGLLAVLCAGFGILIMHSVARIERLFRISPFPDYLHPIIGGIVVGLIALLSPVVLSSGHNVLPGIVGGYLTIWPLVAILLLKTLASIVSLGSGFRGGLFFASIFLGAVLGKIFGIAWLTLFGLDVPIIVFSVVGMCALATAIIGAPLAMSFLALEATKSLPLALAVLFSALISAAIARRFFGFSFATWRFHLRGETIRSAADIGWLRELSVGRLMRKTSTTVAEDTTVAEARRRFPLGSTKSIVLVDENDRYAGVVSVSELHQQDKDTTAPVSALARGRDEALRPDMNLKDAIAAFSTFERDVLVVIVPDTGAVLGTLSEAYSLRRYAEEMNKRLYPQR